MSEQPPEAQHLQVEPYGEDQRVEAPDWYDDTINVGDVANEEDANRRPGGSPFGSGV